MTEINTLPRKKRLIMEEATMTQTNAPLLEENLTMTQTNTLPPEERLVTKEATVTQTKTLKQGIERWLKTKHCP